MHKCTKERVIGLGVFVALAAIFLPLLFYHPIPGIQQNRLRPTIPAAPQAPKLVYDLPLQGGAEREVGDEKLDITSVADLRKQAAKTSSISASMLHSSHPVATVKPDQLSKQNNPQFALSNTPQNIPEAWVVQLATFSEKKNANQLAQTLRQEGLDAYSQTATLNTRTLFRVYVGPYIQYDKIKALQKHLQQQFHLSGVIKKYTL